MSPGKKANVKSALEEQNRTGHPLLTHPLTPIETAATKFQDMVGIQGEDLDLLQDELQNEWTGDDLIADEQQNERVAEVVSAN